MTKKLYWDDSRLTEFTAHVLECYTRDNQTIVVLDQTAFYPLGGGQPCDTGTINSARIIDVTPSEDGAIHHHLEAGSDFLLGQKVIGRIDAARRRELTQQHTGQHILSQAFFQLFGAETRGFRITDQVSEIDLALDYSPDLILSAIRQAEALSNRIVFDNRAIRTHLVATEEAAQMPLRKESFITDCVRVVEIEDFDWSACGGTHATQTGEVGLIVVKGWARAKKMLRLEFLCGVRALDDYRLTNTTTETIARKFSISRNDAVEAVERLIEENKQLQRRNRQLSEIAAKAEAVAILADEELQNGPCILTKVFDDRSFDELKVLAHQLVKTEGVVALLAVKEPDTARLVFARDANMQIDMGALLREVCQRLGGKGGGTPDFAQGSIASVVELEKELKVTAQRLYQKVEEAG